MVVESWRSFCRVSAIKLSIHDFARLYSRRDEDGESAYRIPRGYIREFQGDSPEERGIRETDASFRSTRIAELETDVFKHKKRIADADRKLAIKVTKVAENDKRVGANKLQKAINDIVALKSPAPLSKDYRSYPRGYTIAIIRRDGSPLLVPARYQLLPPGKPQSMDRLDLFNARRDNLTGSFWRPLYGASHAVIPAIRFFESVKDAQGQSRELEFSPRDGSTMFIACLYAEWVNPSDPQHIVPGVAAITDDPAPEVAAAGHDRTPINLTWEAALKWLSPEGRSDAELQALLDERQRPYYEHREAA